MGGSVPLEVIEQALGTHTILVPIANYDNNQHSANENIRLQNLWDGQLGFAPSGCGLWTRTCWSFPIRCWRKCSFKT